MTSNKNIKIKKHTIILITGMSLFILNVATFFYVQSDKNINLTKNVNPVASEKTSADLTAQESETKNEEEDADFFGKKGLNIPFDQFIEDFNMVASNYDFPFTLDGSGVKNISAILDNSDSADHLELGVALNENDNIYSIDVITTLTTNTKKNTEIEYFMAIVCRTLEPDIDDETWSKFFNELGLLGDKSLIEYPYVQLRDKLYHLTRSGDTFTLLITKREEE